MTIIECEDCGDQTWDYYCFSPDYMDLNIPTRRVCKRLCYHYLISLNEKEW